MTNVLATPVTLPCGVVVKNRFYKGAMSEAFNSSNGAPHPNHLRLYQRWAGGGAGVLVTGNVMVDRTQLGEPGNVVVEDRRHLRELRAWAAAGTTDGTHLWMQINHPGKQSPKTINPHPVAPSAVPLHGEIGKLFALPRALTIEEIQAIVQRFVTTATIAKEAGFTGVEIHAAHGYLLSQFLSPVHNQRTDAYGGCLDNRMRILLEIYDGIRAGVGPAFPIAIKMNSSDGEPGGLCEDDALVVATTLAARGVDVLVISGGSYVAPTMQRSDAAARNHGVDAYFVDFTTNLAQQVNVPIALTGGFRDRFTMTSAIEDGITTFIGIARPLVLDPDMPNRMMAGSDVPVKVERIRTPSQAINRRLGALISLSWFEWQMYNIARFGQPKASTNGLWGLAHALRAHGRVVLSPRRAR